MTEPSYVALALQVTCRAVNACGGAAARRLMAETIDTIGGQIAAAKAFVGPDLLLVVLPEYFLTGFPLGEPLAAWAEKAALAPDGPEYERLGVVARQNGVHLAGNAYETDASFPGLYFQTSFLIDDAGDVVLRYRRLNSMYTPTPHDVWDRYLEIYGYDGVFPVADTALGRIAAVASEEILYPELARCLALRGAEVFLHSTSEPFGDGDTVKDVAKRARAIENLAYVVSANSAGITGTALPAASSDGGSKIVGYRGEILTAAATGESMAAFAELDLGALRRWRRRPGMMNLLARQRLEAYAESYARTSVYPPNNMLDENGSLKNDVERGHFKKTQQETIERLERLGRI